MRNLPWLTLAERDTLDHRLERTVAQELYRRHWGSKAPGVSPGRIRRLYILDIRGLFLAAGVLRYTLGRFQTAVLYRGQSRDWESRVPLFRGASTKAEAKERVQWLVAALAEIKSIFDPTGTDDEREALAQHYGLPTRWLDAIDNIQSAAWFAYHSNSTANQGLEDSVGYIYAFAIPPADTHLAAAIDLRKKPSEWLRPHIQQAWAIRAADPDRRLGGLSYLQVATFIVPRPLLRGWSGYDVYTQEVMFPNLENDKGARYWQAAEDELTRKGLLPPAWRRPP
jgi:hypothetical protein